MSADGLGGHVKDSKAERAVREAMNARLATLEQEIGALVRYCAPTELSGGRRLLAKASQAVRDARVRPGEVASWAAGEAVEKVR